MEPHLSIYTSDEEDIDSSTSFDCEMSPEDELRESYRKLDALKKQHTDNWNEMLETAKKKKMKITTFLKTNHFLTLQRDKIKKDIENLESFILALDEAFDITDKDEAEIIAESCRMAFSNEVLDIVDKLTRPSADPEPIILAFKQKEGAN